VSFWTIPIDTGRYAGVATYMLLMLGSAAPQEYEQLPTLKVATPQYH